MGRLLPLIAVAALASAANAAAPTATAARSGKPCFDVEVTGMRPVTNCTDPRVVVQNVTETDHSVWDTPTTTTPRCFSLSTGWEDAKGRWHITSTSTRCEGPSR